MKNFTSIHFFNNGTAQIVYGKDSASVETTSVQEVQNLLDHIKSFAIDPSELPTQSICHIVNGLHAVYLAETEEGEDASYEVVWMEIDASIVEAAVNAMIPIEA